MPSIQSKLILGLMSGSSLDGLDLALVRFQENHQALENPLDWEFVTTATLPYSKAWVEKLKASPSHPQIEALHQEFGDYLGQLVHKFLSSTDKPEIIAVHGHTVFHEPSKGISLQLGAASAIAQATGISCMDDFRTQDIHLGGQGAPLAPSVEHWLFPEHNAFLNLGGICNLSHHKDQNILALDIGAGNQLLNQLAQETGKEFDEDGALAAKGSIIPKLLRSAQTLPFYQLSAPKSLSNQWVQEAIIPLFQQYEAPLADRLATSVALISWQLQLACRQLNLSHQSIVVTGGGAFNAYLMQELGKAVSPQNIELILPESTIIDFKEALLMALMAYLNISGRNNIFSSATGSKINHCAGNLCLPQVL